MRQPILITVLSAVFALLPLAGGEAPAKSSLSPTLFPPSLPPEQSSLGHLADLVHAKPASDAVARAGVDSILADPEIIFAMKEAQELPTKIKDLELQTNSQIILHTGPVLWKVCSLSYLAKRASGHGALLFPVGWEEREVEGPATAVPRNQKLVPFGYNLDGEDFIVPTGFRDAISTHYLSSPNCENGEGVRALVLVPNKVGQEPASVTTAQISRLLGPCLLDIEIRSGLDKKIDVTYENQPISGVMRVLCDAANVRLIMAGSGMEENVSLDAHQIVIRQLLNDLMGATTNKIEVYGYRQGFGQPTYARLSGHDLWTGVTSSTAGSDFTTLFLRSPSFLADTDPVLNKIRSFILQRPPEDVVVTLSKGAGNEPSEGTAAHRHR